MWELTHHGTYVEVRGHVGVSSVLPNHVGLWDQIQFARLGIEQLCLLSHFSDQLPGLQSERPCF